MWRLPRAAAVLRVSGILAALAAGYLVTTRLLRTPEQERDEVLAQVSTRSYMSEIDAALPLKPMPGGARILDARRPVSLAYWSQPAYTGEISHNAVEILIRANRAATLEANLSPACRDELQAALGDADRQIRELALLTEDETRRTKELLRKDPEGHAVITTHPKERDPSWPKVQAASKRLADPAVGAVMGDVLPGAKREPGKEPPQVYHFIELAKWPVLRTSMKEFNQAIRTRLEFVERWIQRRYAADGMRIFVDQQ